MSPVKGLCVSQRSRCGSVRIFNVADEPSTGIVRELSTSPMSPLRGLCVSKRSRCGATRIFELADEPSAGMMRVGALLNTSTYIAPRPQHRLSTYIAASTPHQDHTAYNTARYAPLQMSNSLLSG